MTMSEFIERAVDFTPLSDEERASGESDGKTLEGYAAIFDAETPIRSWEGNFDEKIARGAFKKTLKERKPVMQFNHGHDARFGSLPIGSYEDVREDAKGLYVRGRLFEHAEPIREAIDQGAVSGMSFKFQVVREEWHDKDGKEITSRSELRELLWGDGKDMHGKQRGPLKRTLKEVRMSEAGPVVFPAYAQTTVGVRSADSVDEKAREELLDEYARCFEGEHGPEVVKFAGGEKITKTSSERDDASESETDTSAAPVEGADADESRDEEETPDDAAQAGTSTGLTSSARERRLRLLELAR
jgi:HK97 family phage prohead protease